MYITKTSILSDKTSSRYIDVSAEQYDRWYKGELIQNAMPDLSEGDREFIMSGITPDEWDRAFGEAE